MAFDPVTLGAAVQLAKDPATIKASVEDWLDDHPEAITTVEDGSITKAKLHDDLADEIEQNTADVGVLKSALTNVVGETNDDIFVALYDSSSGYKLNDNGNASATTGYNIYKYAVTAGELYKITTTQNWQFQSAAGISASNRVGNTNAGSNIAVAPTGATYLIVCGTTSETVTIIRYTDKLENLFPDLMVQPTYADGYILYSTGALTTPGNYKSSDYIEISPFVKYKIYSKNSNDGSGYAFYDSSKGYIDGGKLYVDGQYHTKTIVAPKGAKYIRFCSQETSAIKAKNAYLTYDEIPGTLSLLYDKVYTDVEGTELRLNVLRTEFDKVAFCGITLVRNQDGSYTANGTAEQDVRIFLLGNLWNDYDIKAGNYKFIGCPNTAGADKYYMQLAGAVYSNGSRTVKFDIKDYGSGATLNLQQDVNNVLLTFRVISGQTLSDVVIKPMLTTDLSATLTNYLSFTGKDGQANNGEINYLFSDVYKEIKELKHATKPPVYWKKKTEPPYWVLHLDCGNKFFSVQSIKTIIDLISAAGFNQMNLYFSAYRGFRFALDDMNVTDEDGVTYDLSGCVGGLEASTSWYDQDDMDEIIAYADSKGVDIVPTFDMPGHMEWFLNPFPQFKYQGYGTLDFTNPTAVKFCKAVLKKYCKYFASRGCCFWNIGFDELEPDGFATFYANGQFDVIADFANELIDIVESFGFVPRIWNEVVYYKSDYRYFISKKAEVYVWDYSSTNLATPNELLNMGYDIINSTGWFYWVLDSNPKISPIAISKADLLLNYNGYTHSYDHPVRGAVFSIWCADVTTDHPDDGGAYIITQVSPLITAFGEAITRAGYISYHDT